MKKLTLCAVAIAALFSQSINAQDSTASSLSNSKGFYFSTNVGYAFPSGKSSLGFYQGIIPPGMGSEIYPGWNVTSGSNTTIENVTTNLGKGLNFGLTAGYMFNEHIGAEINFGYLMSGKAETKYVSGADWTKSELYSRMLQIKPALILSTGYSSINPYAKLGFIVGNGTIYQDLTMYDTGDTYEVNAEANKGMALGFHAGMGLNIAVSSKLSVFGEINLNGLTYAPKKGKITKATLNGVDQMGSLSISEKEFEYDDSQTINGTDPNQPTKWVKTYFDYNTLSINIGLKYSL